MAWHDMWAVVPTIDPGKAMDSGFRSVGTSIDNDMKMRQREDWDANEHLRELIREGKEQTQFAQNYLEKPVLGNLIELQRNRAALYSGRPDAYVNILNRMDALPDGFTRKLSQDGRIIETVDPTGQIVGTQPNLTGQAAEDAILSRNTKLLDQLNNLNQRNQFEAHLNHQLEMMKLQLQNRLDMFGMGLRSGGGRGGVAGAGGLGSKWNDVPDMLKMLPSMITMMDSAGELPRNPDGSINMTAVYADPAQRAYYNKLMNQAMQNFMGARIQGLGPVEAFMLPMLQHGAHTAGALNQAEAARVQAEAAKRAARQESLLPDTSGDWLEKMRNNYRGLPNVDGF